MNLAAEKGYVWFIIDTAATFSSLHLMAPHSNSGNGNCY